MVFDSWVQRLESFLEHLLWGAVVEMGPNIDSHWIVPLFYKSIPFVQVEGWTALRLAAARQKIPRVSFQKSHSILGKTVCVCVARFHSTDTVLFRNLVIFFFSPFFFNPSRRPRARRPRSGRGGRRGRGLCQLRRRHRPRGRRAVGHTSGAKLVGVRWTLFGYEGS